MNINRDPVRVIGNGWSIVEFNANSSCWTDHLEEDELKGAIGITINDRPTRPIFHRLTTLAARISHYFRNLESVFRNKKAPLYEKLDHYKATHAFVIVGVKDSQVLQVADADDPGVLLHDYEIKKVIDNHTNGTTGYYSKVALVIPPKDLRERVAKISAICSSSLEVGNLLTEINELKNEKTTYKGIIKNSTNEIKKLEKEIKKTNNENTIFFKEKLKQLNEKIKEAHSQIDRIDLELVIKLEKKKAIVKPNTVAPYNDYGLGLVTIAGKTPFLDILPLFNNIYFFSRKRQYKAMYKDYLQVLNGYAIKDKNNHPQAMICSEFATKMLKMAQIDLELECHSGLKPGELHVLKDHLKRLNTVIDTSEDTNKVKIAKEQKRLAIATYAKFISKTINRLQEEEQLFTMKDNGVIPGELLVIGQRKLHRL